MPPRKNLLAPRYWGAHLLALVLTLGAAGFGVWQYQAWSERRASEAADLTRIEPVPLAEVMGPDDGFPGQYVGHPVIVDGTWMPQGTMFVSGRKMDGVEGYWVTTPLQVADGSALMVVRGWTPEIAAAPAPPTGPAEMVVWLQPGEGTGDVDTDVTDNLLPQLRIADVIRHVDSDLYSAYGVVADKAAEGAWPVGDDAVNSGTDGLKQATLEQLPKSAGTTALKNLLYAIEWFIFGGFVVFVWGRWVRDQFEDDDDLDDDEPDEKPASAEDGESAVDQADETAVTSTEPDEAPVSDGSVRSQP
ncbi:SURF1 family protein [Nocardioides sp. Bht2]|uniref:SURF1 family protein n=1 Tax=Nocardioides sp. Bht2 TaxID=3392297 RepID=UPI0039B3FF0B